MISVMLGVVYISVVESDITDGAQQINSEVSWLQLCELLKSIILVTIDFIHTWTGKYSQAIAHTRVYNWRLLKAEL